MQTGAAPSALIGRDGDLSALRHAFDAAVAEGARTVVLGGEAGIGKSRLIAEFTRGLPAEALVLRGQSIDLERDAPPYVPVIGPLRELERVIGSEALVESVGAAREGLRILLPEIAPAEEGRLTARAGSSLVFDAVVAALESVSRVRPVVLVVEDLHWADPATLALLRFLVRVADRGRLLILLSYRSDELRRGHPLRSWLPELERGERVQRRELSRLNRSEVREMVTSLRGEAPDARDLGVLVERSDGVPFFIEEIADAGIRADEECFPDSLRDILLARYDTMGESTQRMLRLLSAGGTCVQHSLFISVYPGDPAEVDAAAREAIAGGVLVAEGTEYTFRHALVRDAIHEELLPGERVRVHTDFARALEHGGSAAEISYHWMAAHDAPSAFAASVTAMREARDSFAYDAAARMGERAIELWDQVPADQRGSKVPLLAETAHDLRNAGEGERAVALVDEALALSDPGHDPADYARMLRDKASYLANIGQLGSIELLREALSVLDGRPPSVLRAYILGELAARLMLEARFAEAVEVADEAYAHAESVSSHSRMSVAANIRGVSLLHAGHIERGLQQLELAGALAGEDDSARLRYWINYSDALALLGHFDEAIRAAEAGAERARHRGVERTTGAMLLTNTVDPLYSMGDWSRADELLDRALELDAPIGFAAHIQRRKLWAVLWRGDNDEAVRLLRRWRAPLSRQLRTESESLLGLARVAGEIALEDGRIEDAWHEVAATLGPEHRPVPGWDLPLLHVIARTIAAARAGAVPLPDDAETRMRAVLRFCADWPTAPVFIALIDAELGGSGVGDEPAAWRAAALAARSATAPAYLEPYAEIRLAEALAFHGDRDGARVSAAAAAAKARTLGSGLILRRVDALEQRLGGSEASVPPSVAGLTEREQQVLELVTQGYSNRQIADELFISIKTASVHVSNILRKLGATTRTEAAYLSRQA
ncbi:AAA family ATPase [Microbacteriaceae bacterium VKM Ac-2854]|nr:AAA family ATPase [Microbacteriaceae bacterium VKM Ac-2854]